MFNTVFRNMTINPRWIRYSQIEGDIGIVENKIYIYIRYIERDIDIAENKVHEIYTTINPHWIRCSETEWHAIEQRYYLGNTNAFFPNDRVDNKLMNKLIDNNKYNTIIILW